MCVHIAFVVAFGNGQVDDGALITLFNLYGASAAKIFYTVSYALFVSGCAPKALARNFFLPFRSQSNR